MFAMKCPLDTREKTWVETRMRWLAERLGIQRLLHAELVVPTERYFPEPYDETPEDAQRLLDRLCFFFGLPPGDLSLEVCEDLQLHGAAGRDDRAGAKTILVAESRLDDPQRLIATLARELAHEVLLGGGLLEPEDPDWESLTDLLTVYLGLGVFTANATIQEEYRSTAHWSGWRIERHGYLPSRMLGYALALFAWMRREKKPAWASLLRPDARNVFQAALRWLRASDDTLFHPATIHQGYRPPTAHEAAERLRGGSPTVRMATLWEIDELGLQSPGLLAAVAACLSDPDPAIPGAAARTLAVFGAAAESVVPGLVQALKDANDQTQAGAAYALGSLGLQPDVVVPNLRLLLGLGRRGLMSAAAAALGQFGPRAESAIGDLLGAFAAALVDCDFPFADVAAQALLAITPDPEKYVDEYFEEGDPELRQLALDALDENRHSEESSRVGQATAQSHQNHVRKQVSRKGAETQRGGRRREGSHRRVGQATAQSH